jgi:hypothetical protein
MHAKTAISLSKIIFTGIQALVGDNIHFREQCKPTDCFVSQFKTSFDKCSSISNLAGSTKNVIANYKTNNANT